MSGGDATRYQQAVAWREAAVADGWAIEPTYPPVNGSGGESQDRAWRLKRDGWVVQGITRGEKDVSLLAWGPDGLAVPPGSEYDHASLVAGLRHCSACGAHDVRTTRYSFAGRCCLPCLPEMRRQNEQPGWAD